MKPSDASLLSKEKVRAKIPGPLAYNSRAGFLPYDTAVLYEMEVVQVTRGFACWSFARVGFKI